MLHRPLRLCSLAARIQWCCLATTSETEATSLPCDVSTLKPVGSALFPEDARFTQSTYPQPMLNWALLRHSLDARGRGAEFDLNKLVSICLFAQDDCKTCAISTIGNE